MSNNITTNFMKLFSIIFLFLFIGNVSSIHAQNLNNNLFLTNKIYYKTILTDKSFISEPRADTIFHLLSDSSYLKKQKCYGYEYSLYQPDYDYRKKQIDVPLNLMQLRASLYFNNTIRVKRSYPPYYSDTLVSVYLPNDTTHILSFIESWSFDTLNFSFNKNVIAIAPFIKAYEFDTALLKGFQLITWIELHDGRNLNSNSGIFIKNVIYDVPLYNKSDCESFGNNIEFSERMNFLLYLLKNVYSEKIPAYDIKSFVKISKREIENILTESDTIHGDPVKPPYDNTDSIITRVVSIYNITKLRFIEEWHFDSASLSFEKKVLGFAPIYDEYDDNGSYVERPLFWIMSK